MVRQETRHDPPMKVISLGELSLPTQEYPEVQVMTVIAAWPPAVLLEVWRCLAGYSWTMIYGKVFSLHRSSYRFLLKTLRS